jgi:hypothetical protein
MAKSNAQRQAEYRERHLKIIDGKGERLNLIVDLHAKRALERLATCYVVTQRALLERLIREAESAALDRAATLSGGGADYTEGHLRLNGEFLTP